MEHPENLARPRAYFEVAGVDLLDRMAGIVRLEALGGPSGPLARKHPALRVRRSARRPRSNLGWARPADWRLSVTAYPEIRASEVLETLCHELAHVYLGRGRGGEAWHGPRFKATMHALMVEAFGLTVARPRNRYAGYYAAALERELTAQARLFDVGGLERAA
jgi:hypothetical protein